MVMDSAKVDVICYSCQWVGQIVVKKGLNWKKRIRCLNCGELWLRNKKWGS